MKKRINKIIFILAAVALLASCEAEYIMFDSSKNFVAFSAKTTSIAEPGGKVGIPVIVTAMLGSPSVTVTFDFDTTGHGAKAAFEGEDYTLVNDSKTLNFPNGWGYDTIWINPVNDDVFKGDKFFNVALQTNSVDYPFGSISSNMVKLLDDEHPLKAWLGSYTVECADYWSVFGPETWNVTTAPDPDDINNLLLTGIGSGFGEYTAVAAVFDMEAMTITLTSGSEIGTHANYGGPLAIFHVEGEGLTEDPIIGTISEDGSIAIDNIGIRFVGGINEGLDWGAYNTTWTKVAKKTAPVELSIQKPVKLK